VIVVQSIIFEQHPVLEQRHVLYVHNTYTVVVLVRVLELQHHCYYCTHFSVRTFPISIVWWMLSLFLVFFFFGILEEATTPTAATVLQLRIVVDVVLVSLPMPGSSTVSSIELLVVPGCGCGCSRCCFRCFSTYFDDTTTHSSLLLSSSSTISCCCCCCATTLWFLFLFLPKYNLSF